MSINKEKDNSIGKQAALAGAVGQYLGRSTEVGPAYTSSILLLVYAVLSTRDRLQYQFSAAV